MNTIITIVGTKNLVQNDSEYKVYNKLEASSRVNDLMDDAFGYSIVFGRKEEKPILSEQNDRLFALLKLKKSRRAITQGDNTKHKLNVEINLLNSIIDDKIGKLIQREHRIMKDNLEYYSNRALQLEEKE